MAAPESRTWRLRPAGLAVGGLIGLFAHELDLRSLVSYWGDDVSFVVLAAASVFLLWHTRARAAMAALASVLGLVWLAAAYTPLCPRLSQDLVRRDPPAPADAVFVLASRIQDDGTLTSTAMTRLVHGLELLGDGYASRLVLSELPPPRRTYAAPARELLAHLRLNGALEVVGPVRNTRDEAMAVGRLFRSRGWRRVLLVTSPVHSRRAAATFEHEGLEVVSSPCAETRYDLADGGPGDRLVAFGSILHEWIGLRLYRHRGWL